MALDADHLDSSTRAELERGVTEFVSEAHEAGWPPERMLVEVKRTLSEFRLDSAKFTLPKKRPTREDLVNEIVTLCIEAYYGTSRRDRQGPPPK